MTVYRMYWFECDIINLYNDGTEPMLTHRDKLAQLDTDYIEQHESVFYPPTDDVVSPKLELQRMLSPQKQQQQTNTLPSLEEALRILLKQAGGTKPTQQHNNDTTTVQQPIVDPIQNTVAITTDSTTTLTAEPTIPVFHLDRNDNDKQNDYTMLHQQSIVKHTLGKYNDLKQQHKSLQHKLYNMELILVDINKKLQLSEKQYHRLDKQSHETITVLTTERNTIQQQLEQTQQHVQQLEQQLHTLDESLQHTTTLSEQQTQTINELFVFVNYLNDKNTVLLADLDKLQLQHETALQHIQQLSNTVEQLKNDNTVIDQQAIALETILSENIALKAELSTRHQHGVSSDALGCDACATLVKENMNMSIELLQSQMELTQLHNDVSQLSTKHGRIHSWDNHSDALLYVDDNSIQFHSNPLDSVGLSPKLHRSVSLNLHAVPVPNDTTLEPLISLFTPTKQQEHKQQDMVPQPLTPNKLQRTVPIKPIDTNILNFRIERTNSIATTRSEYTESRTMSPVTHGTYDSENHSATHSPSMQRSRVHQNSISIPSKLSELDSNILTYQQQSDLKLQAQYLYAGLVGTTFIGCTLQNTTQGERVMYVCKKSPAYTAGLKLNDLIPKQYIRIQRRNKTIRCRGLNELIENVRQGDKIQFIVQRKRALFDCCITVQQNSFTLYECDRLQYVANRYTDNVDSYDAQFLEALSI